MGAIAEGIIAYIQPLLDETDGSMEKVQKAMEFGKICFNLALVPDHLRDQALIETQKEMGMSDVEFSELRTKLDLMIERHKQMFPRMHQRHEHLPSAPKRQIPTYTSEAPPLAPVVKVGPYEPCPCNSGKKFKFCCYKK